MNVIVKYNRIDKNMKETYIINYYEHGSLLKKAAFPKFPSITEYTEDKNKVLEQIANWLDDRPSGISKIVIETDKFSWNESVADSQAPINLDK